MFNAERLRAALKDRGLTQRAAAQQAGLSPSTISRLLKGGSTPKVETVRKLAAALGVAPSFFEGGQVVSLPNFAFATNHLLRFVDETEIHTNAPIEPNAQLSILDTIRQERAARTAAANLAVKLDAWANENFNIPEVRLLDMKDETDPETAARALRNIWILGEQPVGNIISVFEKFGVRVFSIPERDPHARSYSFFHQGIPYVFLNPLQNMEQITFDAAHELGHLVMHHKGDICPNRVIDREANAFASAFLMPERGFGSYMPPRLKISAHRLVDLKTRWGASAAALAHRLRMIDYIPDWQYRDLRCDIERSGFYDDEPNPAPREASPTWRQILTFLWRQKITLQSVANTLDVSFEALNRLLWRPDAHRAPHGDQFSLPLRAVL